MKRHVGARRLDDAGRAISQRKAPAPAAAIHQLQQAAGNRAVAEVIQRLPERWRSTGQPSREVVVTRVARRIECRVVNTNDAEPPSGYLRIRDADGGMALNHIESHPRDAGFGSLLVRALAQMAIAAGQDYLTVDSPVPSARGFYREMGFDFDPATHTAAAEMFANALRTLSAATFATGAEAVRRRRDLDPLSSGPGQTLAKLVTDAAGSSELLGSLDPDWRRKAQDLIVLMGDPDVVAAVPGLEAIGGGFARLQHVAQMKEVEHRIQLRATPQAVFAAADARVRARWTEVDAIGGAAHSVGSFFSK